MFSIRGYAATSPFTALEPFSFERRALGSHDVLIKILYCGVCHTDLHQIRNEWGVSIYPMVPGHEIVGSVEKIGAKVTKVDLNVPVVVGCFVDSCRICANCENHEEQFCEKHTSFTYNSTEQDMETPTYGGYSSHIVVNENYILTLKKNLSLSRAAPLLCAGITTYSPLKQHKVGPGQRVGIIGLGGLGHMGVKFAVSMGADVTVFSTSAEKEEDAYRLGANKFVITKDLQQMAQLAGQYDFLLNTVSAQHDLGIYLELLKRKGTLSFVGAPDKSLALQPFNFIFKPVNITSSLIGGIRETQEMLDYCAEKNIEADIEIIPIQKIGEAFERLAKADVRYRFVIDMNSL